MSIIDPSYCPPTYKRKLDAIITRVNALDEICAHVANGGALTDYCKFNDVRYSDLMRWIHAAPEREAALKTAHVDRDEWAKERILQEIAAIALVDIRQAYDAAGALLPMDQLPESIARAIASVEVDDIFETDTEGGRRVKRKVGETVKVKFYNKVDALRELGKEFGMFVQQHKVEHKQTLEDLIDGSYTVDAEIVAPAPQSGSVEKLPQIPSDTLQNQSTPPLPPDSREAGAAGAPSPS